MELDSHLETFRKQGLEVAALTYDSVAVLKDFATRRKIRFPLLADPDSAIIRRFGLLDPDQAPGTLSYGVTLPTIFEIDAKGVVRAKYFEGQQRRTGASILLLKGLGDGRGTNEIRAPHFVLRTSASNVEVVPGNVVTLALDFDLPSGIHAYAPGVKGYRPLSLRMDPHPVASYREPAFPASRPYLFAPLRETVPVYEGKFRIVQDVSLSSTAPEMGQIVRSAQPTLTLTGMLTYQVCSETICYPPGQLPLKWTFTVRRADTEQVPEALRRKPSGP